LLTQELKREAKRRRNTVSRKLPKERSFDCVVNFGLNKAMVFTYIPIVGFIVTYSINNREEVCATTIAIIATIHDSGK